MDWRVNHKTEEFFGPVKCIKAEYTLKGKKKIFAYLEVPSGVHLLAEFQGRFALIRQYRPAVSDYVYELPGGGVEPGEEVLVAAFRELREEVGLVADRGEVLGFCRQSLAFSNEITWIVHLEGGKLGEQQLEWDEDIRVLWVTLEELRELLVNGTLQQATAFVALWLFQAKLDVKKP